MFDHIAEAEPDRILHLMQLYRNDPREGKIDLGVGVYKNAQGVTPVMRAVKAAEQHIWRSQTSKTYVALAGDEAFNQAMRRLVLGDAVAEDRVSSAATPGGTGALRQAFELIKQTGPTARIWLPNPTWPNHPSIIHYLGLNMAQYRYYDAHSGQADVAGMMNDLAGVQSGDIVLLHGCCHNPTGAGLKADEWQALLALLRQKTALPLIDLAYQGFGDGLEADAAITRQAAQMFPEVLIAASCSKNFGLYRERVGILIAIAADAATAQRTQAFLAYLNRQNYSFPPDHGGRIVSTILGDPALLADWQAELEEIRLSMLELRGELVAALRQATNSDRFDFITHHRGMFSRLGLTEAQVNELRERHGIYIAGDSRMNIAGLNKNTVPIVAKAIAAVL